MNKIIDICTFYPKSKIKAGEGMTHGSFPFYTSSNTLNKYLNSYQIEEDGVILGTGGNASIHYCSGRFSASTDCLVICSKNPDIYNEYLYYYLLNSIHILENGFRGAGLKHISKKYIEDIEISYIPDVNIQKKIINIINKSKILINKRKEQIEVLDELVKSKFIEMFGSPSNNPKQFDVVEFNKIIEYIGDIGSNGANSVISANLKMTDTEDYALMVRTTNFTTNDFKNNVKYVSKEVYDFFKKSKIYGGELIFNKIGSAGINFVMPNLNRPVSLGLNQIMVRTNNKVNMVYLHNLLNTDYGIHQINRRVQGAVTKSITKGAIKEIPIMLPPIELQNQFADFVKQVDKLKFEMEKSLKELEDNFNSLMQKAFKGELFN